MGNADEGERAAWCARWDRAHAALAAAQENYDGYVALAEKCSWSMTGWHLFNLRDAQGDLVPEPTNTATYMGHHPNATWSYSAAPSVYGVQLVQLVCVIGHDVYLRGGYVTQGKDVKVCADGEWISEGMHRVLGPAVDAMLAHMERAAKEAMTPEEAAAHIERKRLVWLADALGAAGLPHGPAVP